MTLRQKLVLLRKRKKSLTGLNQYLSRQPERRQQEEKPCLAYS